MEIVRLREQNRHWESADKIKEDPHLEKLATFPLEISHPVEKNINLDRDGIFIIRGPRQIGKTTFLKRTIRELLRKNIAPRRVLYFALDIGGLKGEREVLDLITIYLAWCKRSSGERIWIFLDEVTYTPEWATGLKVAYDQGLLKGVTCIATGSSSIDLKRGGERLPGRRGDLGEKADLLMLPIDFKSFISAYLLKKDIPSLSSFQKEEIWNVVRDVSYYGREMKEAFGVYLLTGGYPLCINLYLQKSAIDNSAYYTYLQTILGDLAKIGKRESFFRAKIGTDTIL